MDPTNFFTRKKNASQQRQQNEAGRSSDPIPETETMPAVSQEDFHMPEILDLEIPEQAIVKHKRLMMQKTGEKDYQWITMEYDHRHDFFEKLRRKSNIKVAELVVYYSLKKTDGEKIRFYIRKDSDLDESLDTLYEQAEHNKTTLYIVSQPAEARTKRPHEKLFQQVTAKNFTMDHRFYKMMAENTEVAEKFLEKRLYVSLLLGQDCCNFLNPGHYICHIPTCMKLVKLNSFCSLSELFKHIKVHSSKEKNLDDDCKVIERRHVYMTSTITANWVQVRNLEEEILQLNDATVNGRTMALDPSGKFYANPSPEPFKGKHLMANIEVLKKIVNGDPDALSSPEIRKTQGTIQSFLAGCKRPGKQKATKKPRAKKRVVIVTDSDDEIEHAQVNIDAPDNSSGSFSRDQDGDQDEINFNINFT